MQKEPRALRIFRGLCVFVFAFFCFVTAPNLLADTISGSIKDPSGAVVPDARIEITGENIAQPVVLTSDDSGKFASPNLNPGKYSVRVAKDGFEALVTPVDLHGSA